MNSDERLSKFEAKHSDYPEFVKWLRKKSKIAIKTRTLVNYLIQIEQMRNKYGLDVSPKKPKVNDVVDTMAKSLAPSTVNFRRHILRYWVEFRGVKIDDGLRALFKKRKAPQVRKLHSNDLLDLQEVSDIVENTPSKSAGAYFMCLWDTGSRPGALTQLEISDVLTDKHGFVFTFRQTKNEQSKRTVRLIEPRAIARFQRWWADHPERNNPNAPVFINQRGNFFSRDTLRNLLRERHQERLGRGKSKAPLNLYLFRFSRATQLLRDKVLSEMEVKRRLGHKPGSTMLEKVYAILSEEDQSRAELRSMGIIEEEGSTPQTVLCPNCGVVNEAGSAMCHRCRLPLTEKEIARQQSVAVQETLVGLQEDPQALKVLARLVSQELKPPSNGPEV